MLCRVKTVISPDWEPVLRAHALETVDGVYRAGGGRVVARSGSTEVREVHLDSDSGIRTVFVKKYWAQRPSQVWSGTFRGTFFGRSKVRREYENLVRLRAWGFDAPRPVSYGEERWARWLVRSYLISEGVPEPTPLHVFIRKRLSLPNDDSRRIRRELVEGLAACTRRLHERRFVHHDYFWRNILLAGSDLTRFFLIDAHKGRCWFPWEELHSRAKDLAALQAPAPRFFRRAEMMRFFLLYRNHSRLDLRDKDLIRLTLRLAEPMREKQLRRALGESATPNPAPAQGKIGVQ
jgi:hypothetical protein